MLYTSIVDGYKNDNFQMKICEIFSSPELIVYQSSRRPSVRASVRVFTLSNMNISETNEANATKFYLKHHWSGGLAA